MTLGPIQTYSTMMCSLEIFVHHGGIRFFLNAFLKMLMKEKSNPVELRNSFSFLLGNKKRLY